MESKIKENIIQIIGIFFTLSLTLYVNSQYAQSAVSCSWWYIVVIVLWLLIWHVLDRKNVAVKFKILSVVVAGALIVVLSFVLLPEYTYNEAVEIISEEQNCNIETLYNTNEYQQLTWDYTQCKRAHPNYLIVFAGETTCSFMFDPYNGWYEEFNVVDEFPFVLK